MAIREDIKSIAAKEAMTLTDVAEKLGTTINNLSQKLRNKTIKFEEVREIASLLGYDVEFIKRK